MNYYGNLWRNPTLMKTRKKLLSNKQDFYGKNLLNQGWQKTNKKC